MCHIFKLSIIPVFVIFICTIFCGPVFADNSTSADNKLTLSEAIEIAISDNFVIREAVENKKRAVMTKQSAFKDFFPKASARYSYTRLKETPFGVFGTNKIDVSDKDNYHWDVTVTQPVFTGFAISSKYNMAKLGIETKKTEKELTTLDIVKMVKTAYYNILLAKKIYLVADESVNNLQSHKNNSEKFFNQGMIPYNDLLRAQVGLADSIQNREKARARVKMAVSALNTLLEIDINKNTQVEDIVEPQNLSYDLSDLIKKAVNNRSELKLLHLAIANIDNNIKIIQSSRYPQVSMMASYEQNGDNPGTTNNDFSNRFNTSLTLAASWSFFEWGKTKTDTSGYRHYKRSLFARLKTVEGNIRMETKNAFLNLMVAKKNINTSKVSLSQAKENWRITNLQYKQQIATSTDVLDARTFLTSAETNYYSALYGHMISLAELQRAVGEK